MTTDDHQPSSMGHWAAGIRDGVRHGVDYVVDAIADWMASIAATLAKGYKWIAPLAIGLGGCQAGERAHEADPVPAVVDVAPAPVATPTPDVDDGPKSLGKFSITFYYVIGEDEVVAKRHPAKAAVANDNKVAAAGSDGAGDGGSDAGAGDVLAGSAGSAGSGDVATVPDPSPSGDDGELAAVDPTPPVTLFTSTCTPIADVSREFASEIELQGTGKLHDGRVLNIAGPCRCDHSPCFTETGSQWGTGGTGHALSPFRTVAVDPKLVKLGSLLYVPLLEGRLMPGRAPWGGFVHDGCVIADDTGGGIEGAKLDLFVGRKGYYLGLSGSEGSHSWAKHADVFDGSKICQRKGRKITRIPPAI